MAGWKERHLFPVTVCEVSEVKGQQSQVPLQCFVFGLWTEFFFESSRHLHLLRYFILMSSNKDISHTGLGTTHTTSVYLNSLLKGLGDMIATLYALVLNMLIHPTEV